MPCQQGEPFTELPGGEESLVIPELQAFSKEARNPDFFNLKMSW